MLGVGNGGAPVTAKLAKELGILTIGTVTTPFAFEGLKRMRCAEAGIEALTPYVDHLIVISNERLKQISEVKISLLNAFPYADDTIRRCVQSVAEPVHSIDPDNLACVNISSLIAESIAECIQNFSIAELPLTRSLSMLPLLRSRATAFTFFT